LFCLVLIADWVARWPNVLPFYTDEGVLPLGAPFSRAGGADHFSLLDHLRSPSAVSAFFVVGLLCYTALLLGFRTRVFQWLSFLFFVSVLNRNVLIRFGGDVAMATMFAWSMFLPLGARWSLDRVRRGGSAAAEEQILTPPTLAALGIVVQIALIYGLTAIDKAGHTWRDGTAIYYSLHLDRWTSDFGVWFRDFFGIALPGLTFIVLCLEFAAPLLILLPIGQPALRRVAIVGLTGMHLGIWATMQLGTFPFTMMSTYALLLRSADWHQANVIWGRLRKRKHADRTNAAPSSLRGQMVVATIHPRAGHFGYACLKTLRELCSIWLFLAVISSGWVQNLGAGTDDVLITPLRFLIRTLQISQSWKLFAPNPPGVEEWCVPVGVDLHMQPRSLKTGERLIWATSQIFEWDSDRFWKKYTARMAEPRYRKLLPYWAKYARACMERRSNLGLDLKSVEFHRCRQRSPQPRADASEMPVKRTRLYVHSFQ